VDARSHTQQVVVGEVTDDDVALLGQGSDCPDIRSKMGQTSFLDKAGLGPPATSEASLEVATTDKEQPSVDPVLVEGTTAELGHGTCAGPLVSEYDHAHLHVLENSPFFIFSPDHVRRGRARK
jgi:hypothetical protein